jgi:hypothetical protein
MFGDAESDRHLEQQALQAAWNDQPNPNFHTGCCQLCGEPSDWLDAGHELCSECLAAAQIALTAWQNKPAMDRYRIFRLSIRGQGRPASLRGATMFGPELRAIVRERLWERGISQRDLARLVGLTEGAISRFLSGMRETSFETIDRLADVLELEIVIRPRRTMKGE